jgi:hypothetical protein
MRAPDSRQHKYIPSADINTLFEIKKNTAKNCLKYAIAAG